GLGGVEDPVGARIGLQQTVVTQVLVHEQGVQRGRVKTGQEHAHHDQQINLLAGGESLAAVVRTLHALGQIAVVVLKAVAIDAEVGFEQRVVVRNGRAQELLGANAHGRNIKAL